MVVALAVTCQGLPVRSWVFPGNMTDVTTVAKVKRDLKGWKLGCALFVGDSGFNSERIVVSWPLHATRICWRHGLGV